MDNKDKSLGDHIAGTVLSTFVAMFIGTVLEGAIEAKNEDDEKKKRDKERKLSRIKSDISKARIEFTLGCVVLFVSLVYIIGCPCMLFIDKHVDISIMPLIVTWVASIIVFIDSIKLIKESIREIKILKKEYEKVKYEK